MKSNYKHVQTSNLESEFKTQNRHLYNKKPASLREADVHIKFMHLKSTFICLVDFKRNQASYAGKFLQLAIVNRE